MIKDEDIKTLTCLGLTERQAKVYLALLLTGASKAEVISKASMVQRQEIYRVVTHLQEIGLVEKKVNTPIMFNAVPIEDALEILIHRKTQEFNETCSKARTLARELKQVSSTSYADHDSFFSITSGGDYNKRFKEATDNSQEKVVLITTWKRFRLGFTDFEDSIKNSLKRGVVTQCITTEKPEGERYPGWVEQVLAKKTPNFMLKTIVGPPPTILVVYDQAEMALCINETGDLRGAHLWSNNNRLIALGRAYFDCVWAELSVQ
jgi:sugar-specific transcriptional regulator TrmB